jgi:hypothetical protein
VWIDESNQYSKYQLIRQNQCLAIEDDKELNYTSEVKDLDQ